MENIDGYISINYVGYFYSNSVKDCVFILPKVLLEDSCGIEKVFGKYKPEDIIDLKKVSFFNKQETDFIYEFAVWIYRTIVVFQNDKQNDTSIVFKKKILKFGKSKKTISNTFLDVILSLFKFNKENQDFFFFILRNIHSGINKINWIKTINCNNATIQKNEPVYFNPINKKRQINFDEELLIIYYSILSYLSKCYGFPLQINCNFQLITDKKFKQYLNGLGKTRLLQIKYKYFSDKALELWNICYVFFDSAKQIAINTDTKEYLLVKNFNIVFEAIIDDLIGDRRDKIPAGLKDQYDGKRVDHMYLYRGLITHDINKPIYYIGDSKYYKRGNKIGKESVYKQFTYARNVIQWNLNLFMNADKSDSAQTLTNKETCNISKLRDDLTEGYNIIPNFFISARINKKLNYDEQIEITDRTNTYFCNKHFENRLFDRDTLLICHYDVNFLYVVSLYARNNKLQKAIWKEKVRKMFREEIQKIISQQYDFYAMAAHQNTNAKDYIKQNFKKLIGKIYTPFENKNIFSLALEKEDPNNDNQILLDELKKHFYIEKCGIGNDPEPIIENSRANQNTFEDSAKQGVLMVMMENYEAKSPKFLSFGKIAIGIKYTKEGMEIIENLKSIGYILFHHRSKENQHLFLVKDECIFKYKDEINDDYYRNLKDTNIYVIISIDTKNEINSEKIDCRKKTFSQATRYDSQYALINNLID